MTYGKIKVDKIQSSAEELTLPTSAGTSGQVLTSNGSGVLSFADNATGTDLTTTADGTSLTVESSSGNNVQLPAATSSAWGVMSDEDKAKLDAIEASATADQTDAEIRTAVEAATDSNVFTDADHSKLDAIEASATADQTNAEIRAAVEAATDSNVFTDADHSKLDGVAASANNYAISADLLDEDNFASDSATKAASQQSIKAYVDTEVAGLVNSAPGTLDTLDELAAALGDDANYAATITTSLGLKAPKASPAFTGDATFAGNVVSGTDWNSGDGVSAYDDGFLYVRNDSESGVVFAIQNGGNGTGGHRKASITGEGAATFAGNLTAVRGTFTDQVGTTNQLQSNRTSGSNNCFNGQLNGSTTSTITAAGGATFNDVTSKGSTNLNTGALISGSNYILIGFDENANNVFQVDADGDGTFAGHVKGNSLGTGAPDSNGTTATGSDISNAGRFTSQTIGSGDGTEIAWRGLKGTTWTSSITSGGAASFNSTVTCTSLTETSDQRFKKNITDANPQLADVTALGGKLRNWDWNEEAPVSEKDIRFLGLIAQEVESICPGIIHTVPRTKDGDELTPEVVTPAVYETQQDEEGNNIQVEVTPEQITPATYEQVDDSYKTIKTSVLIMKLLGAVTELSAKVAALEAA